MTRADREKRALELRDHIALQMPFAEWTDGAIVQTSDSECYVSTLVTLPSGGRFRIDIEAVDVVTWGHAVEDVERGRVVDPDETGSAPVEPREGQERLGGGSDPSPVRGPRLDDDPPRLLTAYDRSRQAGRRYR